MLVKIPLVQEQGEVIYPDSISMFRDTRTVDEDGQTYIIGHYSGDMDLPEHNIIDQALKRKYSKESIRKKVTAVSQIKFDKMNSLIDSPDLSSLIPTADEDFPGLPEGTLVRDVLRTLLRRWDDNTVLLSDDPDFHESVNLLHSLSIFTQQEVDALLTPIN